MRLWSLVNARNPLYQWVGLGLVLGVLVTSALLALRSPRPLAQGQPGSTPSGTRGTAGTLTEQLGKGRFVLSYRSLLGADDELELQGVQGRLEEPETQWLMESPSARRREGIWDLQGPLRVEARTPVVSGSAPGPLMGSGRITQKGPALQWDHGIWRGLAPLEWQGQTGPSAGSWRFPAGWERGLDGRLRVENGPVVWTAAEPGPLQRMTAGRLWLTLGFQEGLLEEVAAELEGGTLQAGSAQVRPTEVRWGGPITFRRRDGWAGEATGGCTPRPREGEAVTSAELQVFRAQRLAPAGNANPASPERLQADGVRWTTAGLRLEGDVRWEQGLNGEQLLLRAPRVLFREGPGLDLPADLPMNHVRAEGSPVLTWGKSSLSCPRIEVLPGARTWRMRGPVLGRTEQGTFSAGEGQGSPRSWTFQGPIQASFFGGGSLRGERLVWEETRWTFTGSPVTWNRQRERLFGPRVVRQSGPSGEKRVETILFPEGLHGALAALEGDLLVKADRGEKGPGRNGLDLLELTGRVEGRGRGWSLQADRITVLLGPGNVVQRITAQGTVSLHGILGEGSGERVDLDLLERKATWQGRVRGRVEGAP